jgi:hypothetical protein
MITGTICALAMGAIFPLFTILFGDFMDAFNDPVFIFSYSKADSFQSKLGETTANLAVNMVYVGIGAFAAFFGKQPLFKTF